MLLCGDPFSGEAIGIFWGDLPDMIIANEGLCILADLMAMKAKDKVLPMLWSAGCSMRNETLYLSDFAFISVSQGDHDRVWKGQS